MKPISTFRVVPDLPERLARLWDLSHNMWWTWSQETVRTLHELDAEGWRASGRNPLTFLSSLSQEQVVRLASDPHMADQIGRVLGLYDEYLTSPGWFQRQCPDSKMRVAYFSLEFGLGESLPIYSGGLGVLAGDHLKSASDLGLPVVGVGLLYRQGYFRQVLNPDGWQLELYPELNQDQSPVRLETYPNGDPVVIEVSFPGGPVYARIWSVQVGRVPLYLLDANVQENSPEDRNLTAILYGGDREMRIRQEILLGIGGVRALEALGQRPTLCHMNEGHSAFLALERIRLVMEEHGLSFEAAREACAAGHIFTTHTPVAAGNDWFPAEMVERHLGQYRQELGLSHGELLGLGRTDPAAEHSDFCMTVLALRLSAHSNGVSRLHGEVSRRMWSSLWPRVAPREVPITHITNGVHTLSWISPHMAALLDRHLGDGWRRDPGDPTAWQGLQGIPEGELWGTRRTRRQTLVDYARYHLSNQFRRQGVPQARAEQLLKGLDPEALTIGFARRFATYKRGSLVLRDTKRLAALLTAPGRPVQLLFAGKAHPHDHAGKELIRDIVSLSRRPPFAGRVFFLEDYDMNLARYLVQGCDVWLNNPRRPEEASGTSGMKAAINGGLQLSVLDGWWDEACDLHSGWTIGRGEVYEDLDYQDEVESAGLYDLLETEVIPLFYDRDAQGVPRGWLG
ncbi:MAG: alpha-glucan family phosphorylase, partial [Gemmatimonadota bacterium]